MNDLLPDPFDILQMAEEEPTRVNLGDYSAAIETLKEKNLTYREIAKWLTARGVEVTHMQVYRFYKKREAIREQLAEAYADNNQTLIEELEAELNEDTPDPE